MAELPQFLGGSQARRSTVERLLDEAERLEHRLRDVCHRLLELVPPEDDIAGECRRLLIDLDR